MLTSTNTLDKRLPRWSKSIQGNGHQLLILHFCPYGSQLISQLCDPGQVAHHCICFYHSTWQKVCFKRICLERHKNSDIDQPKPHTSTYHRSSFLQCEG
nr:hypothetical protein Q903MT_gene2756 [Picea sitchensis]